MSKKGKAYYRKDTKGPSYKQIIIVLSEPIHSPGRCESKGEKTVNVKIYTIDYSGFHKRTTDSFCDFPESGMKKYDDIIKPMKDANHDELKDFLICLFEDKPYKDH